MVKVLHQLQLVVLPRQQRLWGITTCRRFVPETGGFCWSGPDDQRGATRSWGFISLRYSRKRWGLNDLLAQSTLVVPPVLQGEKGGFQTSELDLLYNANVLDTSDHFVSEGSRGVPVGDEHKQKKKLLKDGFPIVSTRGTPGVDS